MPTDEIEAGDFVTVHNHRLTYEVIALQDAKGRPTALCESGQSNRQIEYFLDHLTLFQKGPGNVED